MRSRRHSVPNLFSGLLLSVALLSPTAKATPYAGSTFEEVRDVLFDRGPRPQTDEAKAEAEVYRAGKLPQYRVTAKSFTKYGIDLLTQAAKRTVTDKNDYYPRLPKLLHPNGICFTGSWTITEPSKYSGYFATGSRALFIGRTSVALSDTEAGSKRGFGFAGKLFPTERRDETVRTANFFTVDVLMGRRTAHFTDTALTNEPELGFDVWSVGLGLTILRKLTRADENPGFRPLTPIAALGNPGPVHTPHWMRIRAVEETKKVNRKDFRDELDFSKGYPNGMRLEIAVSDTTKDASAAKGWTRLGYIQLDESVVSYGCDRQLHFAHPKLK